MHNPHQPCMRPASSLFPFATVMGQVSASYRSVLISMNSYNKTLATTLHPLLFHILSNLTETAFALHMRVLSVLRISLPVNIFSNGLRIQSVLNTLLFNIICYRCA